MAAAIGSAAENREEENVIKSMTGYGRAKEILNKRDITVEVRSSTTAIWTAP